MENRELVVVFHSFTALDVLKKDENFEKVVRENGFEYVERFMHSISNMSEELVDIMESKNSKIAHLIIRAHGAPLTISIGVDEIDIRKEDNNYKAFLNFFELFGFFATDRSSVFLHSCQTGNNKKNIECLASHFSRKIQYPIFASNRNVASYDLLVQKITDRDPSSFPFQYIVDKQIKKSKNYKIMVYVGGQVMNDC